jgi:hypothetical protein
MKNIIQLLIIVLFSSPVLAQNSQDVFFDKEVKRIESKIQNISKNEKASLKKSIDSINTLMEKHEIFYDDAVAQKENIAKERAQRMEERINAQNQRLLELIEAKAKGDLRDYRKKYYSVNIGSSSGFEISESEGKDVKLSRTSFHGVFAAGRNNLIADKSVPNYDSNNYKSPFYELGFAFKTKLTKDKKLSLTYGLSLMFNTVAPKHNFYFVQQGNQTVLEEAPQHLRKSKFNNTYISLPVHLQFNFGKNNKYKVGTGGFVGYNIHSIQNLKYVEDGRKIKDITRADWNVNNWHYGLSAYIGVRDVAIYAKYDLNPLFRNNEVDQHNFSIGVRLEW